MKHQENTEKEIIEKAYEEIEETVNEYQEAEGVADLQHLQMYLSHICGVVNLVDKLTYIEPL